MVMSVMQPKSSLVAVRHTQQISMHLIYRVIQKYHLSWWLTGLCFLFRREAPVKLICESRPGGTVMSCWDWANVLASCRRWGHIDASLLAKFTDAVKLAWLTPASAVCLQTDKRQQHCSCCCVKNKYGYFHKHIEVIRTPAFAAYTANFCHFSAQLAKLKWLICRRTWNTHCPETRPHDL